MKRLLEGYATFRGSVFPGMKDRFRLLADRQAPDALFITCSDSRVVPDLILQTEPGDMFLCRTAGNVIPPHGQMAGGVSATIEYAVEVLHVRHVIVCGHSDCGAMKALMNPELLEGMPNVAAWLRHSHAAECVVRAGYGPLTDHERVRAASLENVVVQLAHLRTHPAVAAGIARGEISLHGWFVDIHEGVMLGLDGVTGRFLPIRDDRPLPVALSAAQRLAMGDDFAEAAE